jgi:hypothetical protein
MDDAKFQERLNMIKRKPSSVFNDKQLIQIVEKISEVEGIGYDTVAIVRFGIWNTCPGLIKRYPDVFDGY